MTHSATALANALADRYRIEGELGQGGMATVYLAHDLRHERKVAIKVLRPDLAAVIGAERFVREIRTIAALQHPHILGLIDSGEVHGTAYYVMPFVEGESLRDRLTREKQLPVADAVRITGEVANALDYAHRHGVVHRDIKPENILLHDGQALVADFGIALAMTTAGGTRMTETGMSLGTPHYMSPEQAMGEREITARSDIYALGCVAYEMLTGEPPFTGPTAQAIIAKVMTEKPRSLVSQRETTPADVEAAVLTALQKLPADRFASAREFVEALHGDRAHTTKVVRAGSAESATPRASRALVALTGLLAVIAAALGWQVWHRPAIELPTMRFEVASAGMPRPVNTFTWPAIASPDGRRIVYAAKVTGGGWQYFVRPIDQLVATPIAGTTRASQPIFSPDGAWLAFVAEGQLQRVRLDGGGAVSLVHAGSNNGATWLSDHTIVLGADGGFRGLVQVSEAGGSLRPLTRPDTTAREYHIWPVALPNGHDIVFAIWNGSDKRESQLAMVRPGEGTVQRLGIKGARPLGVVSGLVVYLQDDGTVMAVPFDGAHHRATGTPVPLLDSIPLCTTCNGDGPVFLSRSGTLTYGRGASGARLLWVDRSGVARDSVLELGTYDHARLSPDGRRIAVAIGALGKQDIWIYQIAGQTLSRLTSQGDNFRPEWMPDGRRIVYISSREGKRSVWMQAADHSTEPEQVFEPSTGAWEATPSPDGRSLVVMTVSSGGARLQLWALELGTKQLKPYVAGDFNVYTARFSPDGRWVAYSSDESGRAEVYVRPFPGPGSRVQISADGGAEPAWRPDGRGLTYVTERGMEEASVAATTAIEVVSRRLLFEGTFDVGDMFASYDVSRDGQRFLIPQTDDRLDLVAAVNWASEVRARLGKP